MGAVDSGNETLLSDDSSSVELRESVGLSRGAPPSPASPPGLPPRIQPFSGFLGNGKVVIRPIAFKPMSVQTAVNGRLSNAGERYGSTPVLNARPGSHVTIYGSSSDLRHHHSTSSNYSLDRKLLSSSSCTSASPPPLASLPLPTGRKMVNYDSLESVRRSPISGPNGQVNGGHKWSYRGMVSSNPAASNGTGSLQTLAPSPSDSGVSELEAALRDRDSELAHLRHTMEHNEQVIFSEQSSRVYQEKERIWERELRRMKAAHENRLRAGAQKALRLEQMLMMQTYQLQQDKQRLGQEMERASREAEAARRQTSLLNTRLEETEWNLCQKTGEIALLKTQLKDAQSEQTAKGHEVLQLKSELRQVKESLERKEKEICKLRGENEEKNNFLRQIEGEVTKLNIKLKENDVETLKAKEQSNREIDRLKTELKELREELSEVSLSNYEGIEAGRSLRGIYDVCKNPNEYHWSSNDSSLEDAEVQRLNGELPDPPCIDNRFNNNNAEIERLKSEIESRKKEFEIEKRKWSEEKEKVLKYQKQLQLNYVQMFRRSRALEAEVESLSLELELSNKHKKSVDKLSKTIEL